MPARTQAFLHINASHLWCVSEKVQKHLEKAQKDKPKPCKRGCSSAGRAPALHAGGQEFDPPHLHQRDEGMNERQKVNHFGRIAQVVRAHA